MAILISTPIIVYALPSVYLHINMNGVPKMRFRVIVFMLYLEGAWAYDLLIFLSTSLDSSKCRVDV